MSRAPNSGPWDSDLAEVPLHHLLSLTCARQWGNLQLFPGPSKSARCAHSARRFREPFLRPVRGL